MGKALELAVFAGIQLKGIPVDAAEVLRGFLTGFYSLEDTKDVEKCLDSSSILENIYEGFEDLAKKDPMYFFRGLRHFFEAAQEIYEESKACSEEQGVWEAVKDKNLKVAKLFANPVKMALECKNNYKQNKDAIH